MNLEDFKKAKEIEFEIETLKFFKQRISTMMEGKTMSISIEINASVENRQEHRNDKIYDYLDCRDGSIPDDLKQEILTSIDTKISNLEKQIEAL